MSARRFPLLLTLSVLLLAGCSSMETLPVLPLSPAGLPGDGAMDGRDEHDPGGSASALLTQPELSRVLSRLTDGCSRVVMTRLPLREVFMGYREDESEPARTLSLSRIGDRDAQMVLAVGVEAGATGANITDVMTLSPRGRLRGLEAYELKKEDFLSRFAGREVGASLKDIDAVTGATAISKALRSMVGAEATAVLDLAKDSARMSELAAAGRQLHPSEDDTWQAVAGRDSASGIEGPVRDGGGGAIRSASMPSLRDVFGGGSAAGGNVSVPAVYVELFLMGLAVILIAIGQLRRKA